MASRKAKTVYVNLPPPRPDPARYDKMYEGAHGFVVFNKAPLAGYPKEPVPKVDAPRKRRKVKWMFSKDACNYLGCTRRHLYWLLRQRGLPYWIFRSGPFPQYAFVKPEIDEWLRNYRGKGRELGLRKMKERT